MPDTEKERLVEELSKIRYAWTWEDIADFLIEDRRRVLKPLIDNKKACV